MTVLSMRERVQREKHEAAVGALSRFKGNKTRAARHLGITRQTLHAILKRGST